MENRFFEHPILNSPYEYPSRHGELDAQGQPTQQIIESRRRAEFITPIPKPRKRKKPSTQETLVFNEGVGLSTAEQQYDPTPIINDLRFQVDRWRQLPNPNDWLVTPETARLLQHWRQHKFASIRPFFCQIEAAETAIWLTEVAPKLGKTGKGFIEHLANSNASANPELDASGLETGDWRRQDHCHGHVDSVADYQCCPPTQQFTLYPRLPRRRAGLTIKDRLSVLQPNDPYSYYASRGLCPPTCWMIFSVQRSSSPITTLSN